MDDFNRLQLLPHEEKELKHFREHFPFRTWYGVKCEIAEFQCFDSRRKAVIYAKKHAPSTIYSAQ